MLQMMKMINEIMVERKAKKPSFRDKAYKRLGKGLGKRFPFFDIYELDDNTYMVDYGRGMKYLICGKDLEDYYYRYAESGYALAFYFVEQRVLGEYCDLTNRRHNNG